MLPNLQAHLKAAQASLNQCFLKSLQSRPKRKIELKKIQRFKKNKKRNAQPTLSDTTTQQRQWFAYGGQMPLAILASTRNWRFSAPQIHLWLIKN